MNRPRRVVAALAGVVATWLAAAGPARADLLDSQQVTIPIFASYEAVLLGFAIASTVSIAIDSPWDDGWAAVELGVAIPGFALGIAMLAMLSTSEHTLEATLYGALPTMLSGYVITHAIWSLATNDADPPPIAVAIGENGEGYGAVISGAF